MLCGPVGLHALPVFVCISHFRTSMSAIRALHTLVMQFKADLQHHNDFAKAAGIIISSTRLNSIVFRLRLYLHIFAIATNEGLNSTEGRAVHDWLNRTPWDRFWKAVTQKLFLLHCDFSDPQRSQIIAALEFLACWRPRITIRGRIMMVNRADRRRWYVHFMSPITVEKYMEYVLLSFLETSTWLREEQLARDCIDQYLKVSSMLFAARTLQRVHRQFSVADETLQLFPLRRIFMDTMAKPIGAGNIVLDISLYSYLCTDHS